jgi:hypothetical protein
MMTTETGKLGHSIAGGNNGDDKHHAQLQCRL